MKRFLFLFAGGALILMSAQVALGLGTHPEEFASLSYLLTAVVALVGGTAVLSSGMLGLAEVYGRAAGQLAPLLAQKRLDPELEIEVRDAEALAARNRGFWVAYTRSGLAVCLFVGGLLLVTVLFWRQGHLTYLAGLTAGLAILGIASLVLGGRSLAMVARTHREVSHSAEVAAAQPEPPALLPRPPETRVKWVRRPRGTPYPRTLEPQRPDRPPRR
ncbi:MAG: hypothetical protein WDA75_08095 [Candidatus Latescibacterota bacterium]